MKNIVTLLLVLFLISCTTKQYVEKKENEEIISLAVDDSRFYVFGTKHDYQFSRKYTLALEELIHSRYAEKIAYIEASAKILDQKKVSSSLSLYILPDYLTDEEKEYLVNSYGYESVSSKKERDWSDPKFPSVIRNSQALLVRRYYFDEGSIVKIKNRRNFIENYNLSNPIPLNIEYIGERTEDVIGSFVIVPLVIVATYLALSAVCINNTENVECK